MKTERTFVAERVAAVHCPELFQGSKRAPVDLLPRFAALAERLARALAPKLAVFCGGEAPKVRALDCANTDGPALFAALGPLAGNSLFSLREQAVPLLVSVDAGTVLGWMDRTFGGPGDVPAVLPEKFPLSVELMLGRIEGVMSAALADALGLTDDGEAVRAVDRNGSLAALAPFPPKSSLISIALEVTEDGRAPFAITLAVADAMLPVLLGESTGAPAVTGRASPEAEPFASLPLELSAVLVDMRISMAAIAALEPGQVLPVSVARQVPIKLAGRTIATGQVGSADDCVAIRISQAFA